MASFDGKFSIRAILSEQKPMFKEEKNEEEVTTDKEEKKPPFSYNYLIRMSIDVNSDKAKFIKQDRNLVVSRSAKWVF